MNKESVIILSDSAHMILQLFLQMLNYEWLEPFWKGGGVGGASFLYHHYSARVRIII